MKTFFTTLAFITLIVNNCNAQVQLTRANNAYIASETFTVHKADTAINVDIVRGNTTWDFNKLIPLDSVTWQTKTTTDSTGIISGRDNITLFSNTGKTEYYSYSDTDALTLNNTMQYDWYGEYKILNYPFTLGDLKIFPYQNPAKPSGHYKYEAIDTLILPNKIHYNAVRLNYYRKVDLMGECQGVGHETFTHACYLWYIPNVSYPIAIAEKDDKVNFKCGYYYQTYTFYYQSNITPRAVPIDTTTKAIQPIPLAEVTDVLNLYPNPVTHSLNVYAPIATQFVIYNIVNQLIQVNTTVAATITINTSNLASGVYIVKTNTGQVGKFVKE